MLRNFLRNIRINMICRKYNIRNYVINKDGSIDVYGGVDLSNRNLDRLPLKFNKVSNYFYCKNNNLTTLEGCPIWVGNSFNCYDNKLVNLTGCPSYVGDDFCCSNNYLTNLIGSPKKVGLSFFCYSNKLTSLEGAPNYVGCHFYCFDNQLSNLIGSPNYVGFEFDCSSNNLTSLEGCPKEIGDFSYYNNLIRGIIGLFNNIKIYLDYQETYNFLRKDSKIVKHRLDEAIKDYNEYYDDCVELPEKIYGYVYI